MFDSLSTVAFPLFHFAIQSSIQKVALVIFINENSPVMRAVRDFSAIGI